MRHLIFVVAAGALLACENSALSANETDWSSCTGQIVESSIPACTRIAEDQVESATERANAYIWRGNAYMSKQDLAKAIADYGEAITLDPRNVLAYCSRAIAYARQGDTSRAIIDYSVAVQTDPKGVADLAAGNAELKDIGVSALKSPTSKVAARPAVAVTPRKPPKKHVHAVTQNEGAAAPRSLDCSNPAGLFACANKILSTLPTGQ